MDLELSERLKWARKRRFEEAKLAAEYLGVPIGTYGGHEAGSRAPKADLLARYAKAFRVNLAWLAYGQGSPEDQRIVSVVGKIAAGNIIETSSEQLSNSDPLFEIELPFDIPLEAIALEVQGDSMYPRYDSGDVIICATYSEDPTRLYGFEVAIGSSNGNRYLKKLIKGSRDGLYNLESHNANPIRDVRISWVSRILYVVRAGQWKKLPPAAKHREMLRMSGE